MTAQTWARVRELFDVLVETPSAQRVLLLDALLAKDLAAATDADKAAIRAEVLGMLAADQKDLLTTNMDELAPELLSSLSEADSTSRHEVLTGLRVGPFCLVRELGRGGMGTVWLADRVDGEFAQQVAIKLIQPGWHAAETNARFRAERQILAGLTHPNIAHLIDGGMTADGRPWLALEYVDGLDLSQYCDQNRLSITERLQLFMTVCDAVSHAHARLIVHRDLKPSNLLVTAAGTVKLLDFGIAKLIAPDAKISQMRSFTPEYAAPEQVRGEVITTSVDVYALGLLLYGLLTGRRPYKLQNSTPAAYERAILEQEPTRPSVAVTRDQPISQPDAQTEIERSSELPAATTKRVNSRDTKTGTAHAAMLPNGLSPERLKRELQGDLDAIVLKALRKNPGERYASAADFAADISNYLGSRPVLARRGGWRYRSLQFMRRHGLIVGVSAAAVLALLGGLFAALYQRDLAQAEAAKSEIVLEFMVDNFRLADLSNTNGEQITARELLDRGAERVADALQDQPEAKAHMLETMGRAYSGLALYGKALQLFEPAIAFRLKQADPVALAYALALKAGTLKSLTRDAESIEVLAQAKLLVPQFPDSAYASKIEARILNVSANLDFYAGNYEKARVDLTRSIALSLRADGRLNDSWIRASLMLSRVLSFQKEFVEASKILNETITQLRAAKPARTQMLADALDALGAIEAKRLRFAEAAAAHRESAQLCEQVSGPDHFTVGIALSNLGRALNNQQLFLEAIPLLERAVRIAKASLPESHGFKPVALSHLANAYQGSGRYAEAKQILQQILTWLLAHPGVVNAFDPASIEARIKVSEAAQALEP